MQNAYFPHMLGGIVRDFCEAAAFWQAIVLFGSLAVASWLAHILRRRLEERRESRFEALRFGPESLKKALFPLLGTVLVSPFFGARH